MADAETQQPCCDAKHRYDAPSFLFCHVTEGNSQEVFNHKAVFKCLFFYDNIQ